MPAPSANPEVDAIEQAYAAQVQALFRQLITNVGDEGVTRLADPACDAGQGAEEQTKRRNDRRIRDRRHGGDGAAASPANC